ncbi:MAG: cytochrome c [SAR324 cluster bacterium]|nr:cytochrome c [SAR324 cluster bacterium]
MAVLDFIMPSVALIVVIMLFTIPGIWSLFFTAALFGTFLGEAEKFLLKLSQKNPAKAKTSEIDPLAEGGSANDFPSTKNRLGLYFGRISLVVMVISPVLITTGVAAYFLSTFVSTKPVVEQSDFLLPEPVVTNKEIDKESIFVDNCSVCHQTNGLGITDTFPPLVGSSWVNGDPEVMAKIVLNGLTGEIIVKDKVYNNVMPGFSGVLSDEEIVAVINHVRSSWGNEGNDEITIDTLAEVKDSLNNRSTAFTADEL